MEFESYNDYFIIHTFKKGISESGRVNLDGLRKKEQMIQYKRARNANQKKLDDNISVPPTRTSSEESSNETTPSYTVDALSSEKNQDSTSVSSVEAIPRQTINKVSAEISTNSIISADDIDSSSEGYHNIRRSSRLSQKDREEKLKREHDDWDKQESQDLTNQPKKKHRRVGRPRKYPKSDTEEEHDESSSSSSSSSSGNYQTASDDIETDGKIVVHDLYESLVPKVKMPQRRSDWILPPRMKFVPEKNLHTRAEYDSVKINELVGTDRISMVLSRFEGGVAGVRTKKETHSTN